MLNKLTIKLKPQVLIWLIACLSISLNIYLLSIDHNKNLKYIKIADEEENSNLSKEFAQSNPDVAEPHIYTIKKGDNLKVALANLGIHESKAARIIETTSNLISQKNILPGTQVLLKKNLTDESNKSEDISIIFDDQKVDISYSPTTDQYTTKLVNLPLLTKTRYISGTINGSLFASAQKAGATPKVISNFITLFSYLVDFQRDIKLGDSFKILYEYQTTNSGNTVKNPTIIYAEISSRGETKAIYRHASTNGKVDYYNDKGQGIKRALLLTPINGAKITSSFGKRTHPIYGYSHMHKGRDYSAPAGTAIFAAGDGVVQFTKTQSYGYGKHIQIRHNATYSTLYAHMSRFAENIRSGVPVKQGQVIGYVGSSGTATGSHLHYEVIEQGVKVNPAKVRFPKTPALKGSEMDKFKSTVEKMDTLVAELESGNQEVVAQFDTSSIANR